MQRILDLPRDDRWQTMARAALRDDLYYVHAQLTAHVLASTKPEAPAPVRIAAWEESDEVMVARAAETLGEICSDESSDLARMSVGLRILVTACSSVDACTVASPSSRGMARTAPSYTPSSRPPASVFSTRSKSESATLTVTAARSAWKGIHGRVSAE